MARWQKYGMRTSGISTPIMTTLRQCLFTWRVDCISTWRSLRFFRMIHMLFQFDGLSEKVACARMHTGWWKGKLHLRPSKFCGLIINQLSLCGESVTKPISIPSTQFKENLPILLENNTVPEVSESVSPFMVINPLRDLANGDPLYTIFADIWNDHVSGNKTKQYNKHNNMYMTNKNLPHRLLQQEFNVHFLATSQHTLPTEQYAAVKDMMW